MSDLTRHASWAKHDIVITGDQEGFPRWENPYSSSKTGGKPDQLTITSLAPNGSIDFHVVMPNKWVLDWQMSISPDGDGTKVKRTGRITTIPWYMATMKLLYSMTALMDDKKLTQKMKADLEG
jgi:hypothetical protein